jgi:hypothetical protein
MEHGDERDDRHCRQQRRVVDRVVPQPFRHPRDTEAERLGDSEQAQTGAVAAYGRAYRGAPVGGRLPIENGGALGFGQLLEAFGHRSDPPAVDRLVGDVDCRRNLTTRLAESTLAASGVDHEMPGDDGAPPVEVVRIGEPDGPLDDPHGGLLHHVFDKLAPHAAPAQRARKPRRHLGPNRIQHRSPHRSHERSLPRRPKKGRFLVIKRDRRRVSNPQFPTRARRHRASSPSPSSP